MTKADEIFETLKRRKGNFLPTMEEMGYAYLRERAERIADYLVERGKRLEHPCDCCWDKQAHADFSVSCYHTPWDDEPTEHHYCSDKCQDAHLYQDDFQYFTCEHCGRLICEQNPANGWHVQVREWENCRICLKCFQKIVLEKGTLGMYPSIRDSLTLPGMFVDSGELDELGFEEHDTYFVRGIRDSEKVVKDLLKLEKDFIAVVTYESMAIGGLEGTVAIYKKKREASKETGNELLQAGL